MKTILLLLLIASSAFCSDVSNIRNAGSLTYCIITPVGDCYLKPSETIFLPPGTYWALAYDSQNALVSDFEVLFETPYVVISDQYSGFLSFGQFPPDPWQAFAMGLSLATPVFAWCLGVWLFRRGLGIGNGALGED